MKSGNENIFEGGDGMKYLKWLIVLGIVATIAITVNGTKAFKQIETIDADIHHTTDKKTITDSSGQKVTVPVVSKRIADTWGAHNEIVTALGAGDKIVATTLTAKIRPWLYKINPQMYKASTTFSIDATNINIEEMMQTKPDVVFSTNNKNNGKLTELGLPVVQVTFRTFDGLKECMRLTASVIDEDAQSQAERYITYLDSKITLLTSKTTHLSREQKPKVLHLASFSPLIVNGKDMIINEAIELAGGINVAAEAGYSANVSASEQKISMEQILKFDPDIIIIGRVLSGNGLGNNAQVSASDVHDIIDNPLWQQLRAVKTKRVYVNPDGAFSWDKYSAEEALEIQWLAKLFHPEEFVEIDMLKETQFFFREFMKYDLSSEEAQRMLEGLPPES